MYHFPNPRRPKGRKSELGKVFTSEIGTSARKFTCLSCKLLLLSILPVKSSSHLDLSALFLQGCNMMAKISSQIILC